MQDANRPLLAPLLAAAAELTDLAVVADGLVGAGNAEVERWQALDRLSQHLAGLALFLNRLAAVMPDTGPDLSEVLAAIPTRALADRLAGQTAQSEPYAGALELFGT